MHLQRLSHGNFRRIKKADVDEEEEFSKLSSAGNSWYCPSCCVTMTAESQAREHVTGWKHLRRQRMLASALCSPLQRTFDARAKDKIGRIICIGDCHTRSSQLMSPLAKSFFYGGSIYSWACETTSGRIRKVPPLASLLSRQDKDRILGGSGRSLLVIWSYGEIDVRMHSSLWREKSDGMDACALRGEKEEGEPAGSTALSLTRGYVRAVLAAAAADYLGVCLCLCGVIACSEPPGQAICWTLGCCLLGSPVSCLYVAARILRHRTLSLRRAEDT